MRHDRHVSINPCRWTLSPESPTLTLNFAPSSDWDDEADDVTADKAKVSCVFEIGSVCRSGIECSVNQVGLCGGLDGLNPGLIMGSSETCVSAECKSTKCWHRTDYRKALGKDSDLAGGGNSGCSRPAAHVFCCRLVLV